MSIAKGRYHARLFTGLALLGQADQQQRRHAITTNHQLHRAVMEKLTRLAVDARKPSSAAEKYRNFLVPQIDFHGVGTYHLNRIFLDRGAPPADVSLGE